MGMNRFLRIALASVVAAVACAHGSIQRKAQPDGSFRVDCRAALTRCLTAIEEVCHQGYEVIDAREDVRFVGPIEPNEPTVTSEVVARCNGPGVKPRAERQAVTPAPVTTCIPGASQACVGPAACQGGQQCLPDGRSFGTCDCGASAPAPVPAPSMQVPDAGM
jgi:hypothetical protein